MFFMVECGRSVWGWKGGGRTPRVLRPCGSPLRTEADGRSIGKRSGSRVWSGEKGAILTASDASGVFGKHLGGGPAASGRRAAGLSENS